MEANERNCPNCQTPVPADAPGGVCPACALRAGFNGESISDAPTLVMTPNGPESLSAEILAERLPELDAFEPIGRGGMGSVYRAMHRNLERPVAVKILDAKLSEDEAFAERFAREARTMAQLDHENVVRIYDFGQREGMYYLVMELVDGVNLRQSIQSGGLEPEEALALVPKICAALQYAHDEGVVHRDIKPENILIGRDGSVKIADFGLAKLVRTGTDPHLTRTDQIMGTPRYMAPEQFEHPESVDHRADIFALGVVFYELLTGELPVGRFPLPSQRVEIDVRLDEVVLRTLEKEPQARYQQAGELRTELMTFTDAPAGSRHVGTQATHVAGAAKTTVKNAVERGGIDWRSQQTLFGLPLIHICTSGESSGRRMKTASGIIAIGDIAIGLIAIGGFSFGGISIGGMGLGLIGIGGVMPGLLLGTGGLAVGGMALGGLSFGGFAIGALAFGWAGVGGSESEFHTVLTEAVRQRWILGVWLTATVGVIGAVGGAIYAWMEYQRAKEDDGGVA